MRLIRIITLAAVAAMLTPLPSQVRADEAEGKRTVTKSYVAGDVLPTYGAATCGDMVGAHNVGVVCFGRILGDVITLKIEDDSGRPVGGMAEVGNGSYYQHFCGESSPFPNSGDSLRVFLETPGQTFYGGCPLGGSLPTKGRVLATFTTRGP